MKALPLNKKGFNPFCELIGLEFDSHEKGSSQCRLAISPKLFNPHGVVHGGVVYSMADTGMGAALYPCMEPGHLCATVEIKISYFKPATKGELICQTRITHLGKKIAFLHSDILQNDRPIASATGTYCIFPVK